MTPETRARVVELLRCAADLGLRGFGVPLSCASEYLDASTKVRWLANEAVESFPYAHLPASWPNFGLECLEAAALVEEGWNP
jgi:hypothetical protein